MRKKSHIALSAFLVDGLRLRELDIHRKAFYFGSIQPDLNPRMFSEPHQFDETWEKVQDLILQIEAETRDEAYNRRAVWTQVGVVMHYLADYFTFPHNTCFDGSLSGHCMHESELKYLLRAYLCTSEAKMAFERQRLRAGQIRTSEQLFTYIEKTHEAYMRASYHSVLDDCRWITELCFCAGAVFGRMICREESQAVWLRSCVA
ncbi:MAG: zinc dependent phospholipase C family protein [Lachnospiraceae bacterium]|nr:zinc dependent phospholipase C family protein [Lachnospiraceae bacterium]